MSKYVTEKDLPKIKEAMKAINALNAYFDQRVSLERVVAVDHKINEPWLKLSVMGRYYVMDGQLKKSQDGMFGIDSSHVRHFYLFSDSLFYTSKVDKHVEKPHGFIYLKHCFVRGKEDDYRNGIDLQCFDKKWKLFASTPPEHNAWFSNFKTVLEGKNEMACLPCIKEGYKVKSFKVYGNNKIG